MNPVRSTIAALTGDPAAAAASRADGLEKKAAAARSRLESLGAKANEAKALLSRIVAGDEPGDSEKVAVGIIEIENAARAAVYEADALVEAATTARATAAGVAVRVARERAEAEATKLYVRVTEIEEELHGRLAAVVDLVTRGNALNSEVQSALATAGQRLDARAFDFDRIAARLDADFAKAHANDGPNGPKWADFRLEFRTAEREQS